MKATLLLSVLASAAVSLVAAEELDIKITQGVECERKTQKGDQVSMHYLGTLADGGKKFDASQSPNCPVMGLIPVVCLERCAVLTASTGYDRNQPLTFKLGSGQVIKGFVISLSLVCSPWCFGVANV